MTVSEMRTKNEGGNQADNGPGGARQWVNKHPIPVIVAIAALIGLIVLFMRSGGQPEPRLYFTTDDGQTHFEAKRQAAPFMKDGKEAVEVAMFTCNGGTPFVGYLRRYPPDAKAKVQAAMDNPKGTPLPGGAEVKRPGDKEWVKEFDIRTMASEVSQKGIDPRKAMAGAGRYNEITTVKCPDGKANATAIYPE
jgi:hypothetical protein